MNSNFLFYMEKITKQGYNKKSKSNYESTE